MASDGVNPGRNSERNQLKRLQQLEKAFFPPPSRGGVQGHAPTGHGDTMYTRGPGSPEVMFLPPLGRGSDQSPVQRGAARVLEEVKQRRVPPKAAWVRRKPSHTAFSYGSNPLNPFEAVVEATPAIRYLSKDWRQLSLLYPDGTDRSLITLLQDQLAAYVQENLSDNGCRVATSPLRSLSPSSRARRLRQAAAQQLQQQLVLGETTCTTTTRSATLPASRGAPHLLPSLTQVPEVPAHMLSATMPPRLPGHADRWDSPARHSCPPASPITIPGVPTGAAPSQGGYQPGPPPGLPPGTTVSHAVQPMQPLPSAGAQAAFAFPPSPGPLPPALASNMPDYDGAVSLTALMSETHSARRQAQLIADWLDGAIAQAWDALHDPEDYIYAELLAEAAAMRAQQHADTAAAGSPQSARLSGGGAGGARVSPLGAATPTERAGSPLPGLIEEGGPDLDMPECGHGHGHVSRINPNVLQALTASMEAAGKLMPHRPTTPTTPGTEAAALHTGLRPTTPPAGGSAPHSATHSALSEAPGAGAAAAGPPAPTSLNSQDSLGVVPPAMSYLPAPELDEASAALPSHKAGLAHKFAAIHGSLQQLAQPGGMPNVADNPALWNSMVQVVCAASGSLVQHLASGCWEEAALLARLWNLNTSLLDSGLVRVRQHNARLQEEVEGLKAQVRRLDPLIDWDKQSREEMDSLRKQLESTSNHLLLARSERDALLRENDKIIAYYKKELRNFKKEQRRDAFKLARKLKWAQEQLALMQRDRDQLINAVTYTKEQTGNMATLIGNVHHHLHAAHMDSIPELVAIETGLRSIQSNVTKVQEVTRDAEESHFVVEEQVSAIVAADDIPDELLEQVLGGGDPEAPDAPPPPEEDDSGLEPPKEESHVEEHEEEEEEEEDAGTQELDDNWWQPSAARSAAASQAGEAREDEAAALEEELQQGPTEEAQPLTVEVPEPPVDDPEALSPNTKAAMTPHTRDEERKKKGGKRSGRKGKGEDSVPASPTPRPGREQGCQTDGFLLEGYDVNGAAAASAQQSVEALQEFTATLMSIQEEMARVMGDEGGVLPSPRSQRSGEGAEPSSPRQAAENMVQGITERWHAVQAMLNEKARQLEGLQQAHRELKDSLDTKTRDVNGVRQQLLETRQQHSSLRTKLQKIGLDPDAHDMTLPEAMIESIIAERIRAGKLREGGASPAQKMLANIDKGSMKAKEPEEIKPPPPKITDKIIGKTRANDKDKSPPKKPPKAEAANTKEAAPAKPAANMRRAVAAVTQAAALAHSSPRATPASRARSPPDTARSGEDPAAAEATSGQALAQGRLDKLDARLAAMLNKDRTGMERLQEAIAKYSDIKPRTQEWLIKLIDAVYKGKASSDEQRAKQAQEPLPLADYLFQHLSGTYGTRDLVNQYAAQTAASLEAFRKSDVRVATFHKFLFEAWDAKLLAIYMDGMRKLAEPARIPCCDFPPDYATRKGDPTQADVRKCLWVADKLLMKRGSKAAYAFATSLAVKGEGVNDAELAQYFVAPGYYGADVANVREYEKGRAEFRKMQVPVFLDLLCEEYLRCEAVYQSVLPSVFKKWDQDADGFLSHQELTLMMEALAPQGVDLDEVVGPEVASMWANAVAVEAAESRPEGLFPEGAPHDMPPITQIGLKAFIDAGLKSDWLRGYVRLHKTPAAKLRLDNSNEDQARVLLQVLISRHWKVHGGSVVRFFQEMGPLEPQLLQQVSLMEREKDGGRKALLLHGLLKLMINRKLDKLVALLSQEALAGAIDPDFEEGLARMTRAVKVLYGSVAVIEDDLLEPEAWRNSTPYQEALQRKMVGQVFSLYNKIRDRMRTFAGRFISQHYDVQYWAQKWRENARRKAQSRNNTAPNSPQPPNYTPAPDSAASSAAGSTTLPAPPRGPSPVVSIPTTPTAAASSTTSPPAASPPASLSGHGSRPPSRLAAASPTDRAASPAGSAGGSAPGSQQGSRPGTSSSATRHMARQVSFANPGAARPGTPGSGGGAMASLAEEGGPAPGRPINTGKTSPLLL